MFDISVAHTIERQNREPYQGQNAKYNFKSDLGFCCFFFFLGYQLNKEPPIMYIIVWGQLWLHALDVQL